MKMEQPIRSLPRIGKVTRVHDLLYKEKACTASGAMQAGRSESIARCSVLMRLS